MNTENLKTLIKNDVIQHTNSIISNNSQSKKNVFDIENALQQLANTIKKIDFEILAFPDIENIKKELKDLECFIYNEDGSYNKENPKEQERYKVLNKKLNSYKLNKTHFLVICVEQIQKIAIAKNWGLCKKNGFIYLYNGFYWHEIDKEPFQYFLGNVAINMGVEKFKGKIHTFKDELYKQFLSDSYLPTPQQNKDKVLINLQNGTFEISENKRELRPFERNDFLTHQLNFEYEPDATAPLFQKYLDEVLPDTDKQKVLAEYCGYIFIKKGVLSLEKMLVLYGTGANGKSVFFEILNALLGSQNVSNYSLQSLTNENGYFRAKIGNKLVNYASEMNGKLETDVFKQMASGEPVEARLPYCEPFNISDYAKLIFNCNELPKDVEHTNAYFRRFLIIGFDVTIPENKQDKELSKKIINSELSGVFNWILQGLKRLLEQKKFSKCIAIENARTNYEKQSDSVKMFIDESEYKTSTNYTLISYLYNEYKAFCIEDGFRPVNKSNFIKRLNNFKIVTDRKAIGNVAFIQKENDL